MNIDERMDELNRKIDELTADVRDRKDFLADTRSVNLPDDDLNGVFKALVDTAKRRIERDEKRLEALYDEINLLDSIA